MKVKIFGAGSIGNHLSHAARHLGWSVDLVDIDLAALRRTRDDIYPSRYGSWDDAIGLFTPDVAPKEGYDLIFIGTPPDSHMALALAALEEGPRAILIEKPVCTPRLENANELLAKAKARSCRLFVGYDHVVGAAAERFCALIDAGIVGEPQTLDVEFREHWGGILAAHPWLDSPASSYLGFWQRGGGAAGEHSHGFNLWQHFAHRMGKGRVKQVTASLDYVAEKNGAKYDRLCLANLETDAGLLGRVVQDVVTRPVRKWARLQGTDGFIEWVCGHKPGQDAVIHPVGGEIVVESFNKTRPDDFILELRHIATAMNDSGGLSSLAIERGLDTMTVVAACHRSAQEGRSIRIDWDHAYQGYSTQD